MYLLYYNSEIIKSCQEIEVLRLNLLILIYKLYISDKINKICYLEIKNSLLVKPFFEDNLPSLDLKDINIKIEKVSFIQNGKDILNKMKKHVDERFAELQHKLISDVRVEVTFPGQNAYKHTLGTMYKDDWKLLSNNLNDNSLYDEFISHITDKIVELINDFDKERIKFGDVMYENASNLCYQVWSANAINYNLPLNSKIPGDYQAIQMKVQKAGVFGIVTTPMYGY